MRKILIISVTAILFSCSSNQGNQTSYSNLESLWDTIRPLPNPDKGWYHHLLDNGTGKYAISDEAQFYDFPGMDHLYLRLAWAYLEPEEGKYNWSYIDDVVEKYVPKGYGISFRISCKETGPAPSSVPYEINGIRYATPYWVRMAGAKGTERPEFGSPSWTPVWDDPVYLEKLNNFHQAFAERYDNQPWIRYVDVGSIGEWGEGHTHFSTRIPPTKEEVKIHMDLYRKHYQNAQLVVTDDLLYWNKPDNDVNELLDYAIKNNFTLRDDSPLVDWYVDHNLDTWSVSHPHFFEAVYKQAPTVFELQHYGNVKQDGNWIGANGEEPIPDINISGAEIFRQSVRLIHPTYIGYHGYMEEWLKDNPLLTNELLNLTGYWYFPKSIQATEMEDGKLQIQMEWLNKGVAPAYNTYSLKGLFIPADMASDAVGFEISDSGNRNWLPDSVAVQVYDVTLPENIKGRYKLGLQLYDERSSRPVELGLKTDLKDNNGYYTLHEVDFK